MNERIDYVRSAAGAEALSEPADAVRRQEYVAAMLGCSAIYVDNTNDHAYTVMSKEEIQRAAIARATVAVEA